MTAKKGQKWTTIRPPARKKMNTAIPVELYEMIKRDAARDGVSWSKEIEYIIAAYYLQKQEEG